MKYLKYNKRIIHERRIFIEEKEYKATSIEEQKREIRERYKGVSSEELDVIPAIVKEDFYHETQIKRVGVYARVSTDDPRQTSSYELQKNHYTDLVNRRENWRLIEIYADEGISGTSLKHRDAFVRMIDDCQKGKLDLIVTKSVSRFARNVVDCIGYVRALAALNPPVGVFFETENIYTLNSNAEMSLSFISTLAQEESHTKSEIMNSSIEMRFRRGIFLTPVLLGYDHDSSGNLVINDEEAKTVKLCFFLYYLGYSSQYISEKLVQLKRKTKKLNESWSPGSVLSLLQNERYCGDVLARKTWTPNYLDHKPKKNCQDRNQYRQKDHHEAIVPRDLFIAVQHLIMNRKYGRQSHFPCLYIIPNGAFKGFVLMNPRWRSFHAKDYADACLSVYEETTQIQSRPLEIIVRAGEYDLRKFEISHTEYLRSRRRPCLLISQRCMHFSVDSVKKLKNIAEVEFLIHPNRYLLVVRPARMNGKNSITWARRISDKKALPKFIVDTALLQILYELCQWREDCSYRILGNVCGSEENPFLLFDLRGTETLIPSKTDEEKKGRKNKMKAYPYFWIGSFGDSYYTHGHPEIETYIFPADLEFSAFSSNHTTVTSYSTEEVKEEVNAIIQEIKEEQNDE